MNKMALRTGMSRVFHYFVDLRLRYQQLLLYYSCVHFAIPLIFLLSAATASPASQPTPPLSRVSSLIVALHLFSVCKKPRKLEQTEMVRSTTTKGELFRACAMPKTSGALTWDEKKNRRKFSFFSIRQEFGEFLQ